MAGSPADRKEKQAATHAPIRGIPQIRTGIGSPVWAVSGDLLLVAVVRVDRPSDRDSGLRWDEKLHRDAEGVFSWAVQ
jgi:hypothetical protein